MKQRWFGALAALTITTGVALLHAQSSGNEARSYDRLQGRWNRAIAATFLRFAHPDLTTKLLDFGCATGTLATSAAMVYPNAELVGIDTSEANIAWARQQTMRARVRFQTGELVRLPFRDGEFDSSFALQTFSRLAEPERALHEMARVTKPEGVVAAAVWDYGASLEPMQHFWNAAMAVDPALSPADGENMPFSKQGQLEKLWTAAGLRDVTGQAIEAEVNFRDFEDYWSPFLDDRGPAGLWLAAQPEAKRNAVRERLRARIVGSRTDGPFVLRVRAWAVRGIVRYR